MGSCRRCGSCMAAGTTVSGRSSIQQEQQGEVCVASAALRYLYWSLGMFHCCDVIYVRLVVTRHSQTWHVLVGSSNHPQLHALRMTVIKRWELCEMPTMVQQPASPRATGCQAQQSMTLVGPS